MNMKPRYQQPEIYLERRGRAARNPRLVQHGKPPKYKRKPPAREPHLSRTVTESGLENLRIVKLRPRVAWNIPQIAVPLWWFDEVMVRKKLIIPIPPDIFVVGGHRFKVLFQEYKQVGSGRLGYTRWMVYEETTEPGRGRP
jgi:hypothetical protein